MVNHEGKPQITLADSQFGLQYRALYTETLKSPVSESVWMPFGSPCGEHPDCWVDGNGGPLTWIDESGAGDPERFYIIQVR